MQEYLAWAFELSGAPQDADELQRLRYCLHFPCRSPTHTYRSAFLSNLAMIHDIHGAPTSLVSPGTSRSPELQAQSSICRPLIDSPNDYFKDLIQTLLFENSSLVRSRLYLWKFAVNTFALLNEPCTLLDWCIHRRTRCMALVCSLSCWTG